MLAQSMSVKHKQHNEQDLI